MVVSVSRLKKGKQLDKEEAIVEVKKNIHLIKAPHAGKMPETMMMMFSIVRMKIFDPKTKGSVSLSNMYYTLPA